ncbi:MAG: triose-phosphate isomerase [Candidatus Magasanikbacteria bacterium]|nr:triose-phosphate isomerase [Candidatus Magasanikbacteria bacterium]
MKYFIANWKMYLGLAEARALAEVARAAHSEENTQVVVCPSFAHIDAVGGVVRGSAAALGAQDAYFEPSGAYTSAVGIEQLKELGVSYVLVGHSERRHYFGETDDVVNKKVKAAYAAGIQPIICVGETEQERSAGQTKSRVSAQVHAALQGVSVKKVIIAYEPVWAIGAGKTPSVEDAQSVHRMIKQIVKETQGAECSVLYGGSVTQDNLQAFWNTPDIDGVLVGGASAHKKTLISLLALLSH